MIVPKIIVKISKWTETWQANSSNDGSSNSSQSGSVTTIKKTSELFAACADHFFNFISCISLYVVTRHLFYREEKDRTWQYFLERTILMLLLTMGAILLEKILLHLLAIEFHRSLYQERVFKSMYNQWVLASLRNFIQHVKQQNNTNSTIKTAKISNWSLKTFPHRNTDDLISTFLLENASFPSFSSRDQLCREIFKFFDPENDGKIHLKHLELVFTTEEARKVQNLLSNNSANSSNSNAPSKVEESTSLHVIDRDTLKKSIQAIHQDRWDLSRALTTHASIVKKLDRVMLGFIFAVILYFSPIMGYELEKSNIFNFGVTLAPLILSFTEFFGDSLKRTCEAIIYIVTCHPYDIGDRVSIDGVDFFVHKIGLVSTTFKRFDGFMVWFPNYVLAKKALCNIRRTGMQGQRLEIQVEASVPLERIQVLANSVKEFIRNDTRDFEAVVASFFDLQQSQNTVTMVFLLKHRFNFQDGVQRAERQNRFLLFLREKVTEMGIEYHPPVLKTLLEADEQIRNHLANSSATDKIIEDPFTSL